MNITVNATKSQIEDFKESVIWKDFIRELLAWKKGFNDELLSIVDLASDSNPSTASVLLHMGDLNGRMKAVDYVLTIPDVFLSVLEDMKKETKS